MRSGRVARFLPLLFVAFPLAAQAPRVLGAPEEFAGDLTSLRGLRALPDGRLIVTDSREKKILLIDFAKGSQKELARSGQGPQEFQQLGQVTRDKGGGVIVYDPQQRRHLPITADAKLRDVRPVPNAPSNFTVNTGDGPDMYVLDTVGNVYQTPRSMATMSADSIPLQRGEKVLTQIKQGESRNVNTGQQGMTMRQQVQFSPRDAWAVSADGWVAVARNAPYRVEWYAPNGQVVRGEAIAQSPIPVTEADKKEVRDRMAAQRAGGNAPRMSMTGGPGGTQNFTAPTMEPVFAETKPAVKGGGVLIDESGRAWVERSQAAGAKTNRWDVFDRTGKVVMQVEGPAGSRLVGFDRSWVYAVRTDDDDLLHLQRFRMP